MLGCCIRAWKLKYISKGFIIALPYCHILWFMCCGNHFTTALFLFWVFCILNFDTEHFVSQHPTRFPTLSPAQHPILEPAFLLEFKFHLRTSVAQLHSVAMHTPCWSPWIKCMWQSACCAASKGSTLNVRRSQSFIGSFMWWLICQGPGCSKLVATVTLQTSVRSILPWLNESTFWVESKADLEYILASHLAVAQF